MTHYDTLGVPKDADAGTIKRAYRRKSKAAHPDKGGSHKDMVEINRAYETLSDPEKRERYDQTGEDGAPQKSIDDQARDVIMQAFTAILERASDTDNVIDMVGRALGANIADLQGKISAAAKRVTKLERSIKRLKCKGKQGNFLEALMADQIVKTNASAEGMKLGVRVFECAQTLLSDFTWEADEMPQRGGFVVFTTAGAGFTPYTDATGV